MFNKKEFNDPVQAAEFFKELTDTGQYNVELSTHRDKITVYWIEKKQYQDFHGNTQDDRVWLTEDGQLLHVQDLSEAHAKNIIRMMLKQSEEHYNWMVDAVVLAMGEDYSVDDVDESDHPVVHNDGTFRVKGNNTLQ